MADVAITFRVMPISRDTNLEYIKSEIKKIRIPSVEVKQIIEKPIAFGLKSLEVLIILPDYLGPSRIEESIKRIHGVESIETVSVTLI